ncbi:MAG TPA: hypothetical protein DEQ28_00350 [Clostridiales bacterium]|nr:hypothetical protein [Clostridiales bacterium]
MNKLLRERDLGTFVAPARISLDEYLNRWLETAARPRLRPRTFESYRDCWVRIRPTTWSSPASGGRRSGP